MTLKKIDPLTLLQKRVANTSPEEIFMLFSCFSNTNFIILWVAVLKRLRTPEQRLECLPVLNGPDFILEALDIDESSSNRAVPVLRLDD